jgi:glycosyltransferase A (GT-A) superfamily protein (DUF2064 family)
MATLVVLADPPVEGFVLPEIVESTPVTAAEATRLYEAMLTDLCRGIQASAGDLLVNYRPADQVPEDVDPEASLRAVLDDALEEPDEARYEVQVGETFAGRAGNTATHLLDEEDEDSIAIVKPATPFLGRQQIGSAAMKIRSSDVVLGPTTDGRLYYAGFSESIDFENAYAAPAVETLTARARDADLDVDFLSMAPVVETGTDLANAVAQIRARLRAERNVPIETATVIDDLGLYVEESADGIAVARTSDSS